MKLSADKPEIEGFEIRELKTAAEIRKCIDLQGDIWGLDELGRMSPITLKAMVSNEPKTGFVFGGFLNHDMIAVQIVMATLEPHTVYLHMLGIREEYRNLHIGYHMQTHLFRVLRKWNITKWLWTYEPLEGRNANEYLDKSGAKVIRYLADYYQVTDEMSAGMPIDRFLAAVFMDDEWHIGRPHAVRPSLSLENALKKIPIATAGSMPETDRVLVEIPADLQELKATDMQQAIKFRLDTREIFTEYINRRGYFSDYLYSGVINNRRRNYYLLHKPVDEKAS